MFSGNIKTVTSNEMDRDMMEYLHRMFILMV